MESTILREFSALKNVMIEVTTYCPNCGNKKKVIKYKDLTEEPMQGFMGFRNRTNFLHCKNCKSFSLIFD